MTCNFCVVTENINATNNYYCRGNTERNMLMYIEQIVDNRVECATAMSQAPENTINSHDFIHSNQLILIVIIYKYVI